MSGCVCGLWVNITSSDGEQHSYHLTLLKELACMQHCDAHTANTPCHHICHILCIKQL